MRLREVFEKLSERIAYTELSEEAVEEIGYDFILELVENDVAYEVAEALIKELAKRLSKEKVPRFSDKKKLVREELKKLLYEIFEEAGRLDLEKQLSDKVRRGEKPQTILFLGPNGHGKTTTIAKLANRYKKKGFSVVVAAADTFRAGAIEQIKKWSEKIGVPLISHGYGADPAAVAYDALLYAKKNNIDIVLVDTAGRMHTNVNLLDEMKKIVRVLEPDYKIYVGDALIGNDAVEQARIFSEKVGIDGSILTKFDADVKGGAVISIVYVTRKPIIYVGVGQGVDDIKTFDYKEFIDQILR